MVATVRAEPVRAEPVRVGPQVEEAVMVGESAGGPLRSVSQIAFSGAPETGSRASLDRRGPGDRRSFVPPPSLPGRQVLADSVYDVVKQQIMDLKLAPSERLNIDQLARELEVSNTPLREALARLEAEGLVTRRSLQGFTVAPVPDLADLHELFELRLMLEPEAARAATKHLGPEDLALLRSSVERMVELADGGESGHYRRHQSLVTDDAYFHDFVAKASGSKLLRRTVSGLHAHTALYRVYFKAGNAPEGGETADEHATIVDALAEKSPSEAARAMREHLRRSRERLRRVYHLGEDPSLAVETR